MNCYDFYVKYLISVALDKPHQQWSFRQTLNYYSRRVFIFLCVAYLMIFSSLDIYFKENIIFEEIAFHALDIGLLGNCLFRIIHAIRHNKDINMIINQMNSFKSSADANFEPRNIQMIDAIKQTRKLMIGWVLYASGCIAMIHLSALFEIFATESARLHVIPIYCHYDCTSHPYYEFTLVFEMLTQQMHGLAYINLDLFFFGTVILLSKQFDILSSDIKNIMYSTLVDAGVDVEEVQDFKQNVESSMFNYEDLSSPRLLTFINSKSYSRALKLKMGACIRHQQLLNQVLTRLQSIISLSSFVQVFLSTGYMMFSLFAIVVYDDKAVKMNAFSYMLACAAQISLMCIVGQMLSNKFDEMRLAVTEIPWYLIADKNFRLSNIIVMIDLNKSHKVAAGAVFDLSHQMLLQIYRSAFTYYTVLMELFSE